MSKELLYTVDGRDPTVWGTSHCGVFDPESTPSPPRFREYHRRVGRGKGPTWGDPAAKEYLLGMAGPLHSGLPALWLPARTCTGSGSSALEHGKKWDSWALSIAVGLLELMALE